MKRILMITLTLFALSACGHGRDTAGPSAITPTLGPTFSPVIVDLTERLQAAEEQDVDLDAYDVGCTCLELCPGFDEYTGWLSVEDGQTRNLRFYHRRFANSFRYEAFYSGAGEEDSIAVIITDAEDENGFQQKLTVAGEPYGYAKTADFTVEDLNFDGYPDVKLFLSGGRGGQMTYTALLWDPETRTYGEERSFADISAPIRDDVHHLYWGGYDVNWRREERAYEYLDGRFVCTHALIVDRDTGAENAWCAEWMLENGRLRPVGSLVGAWEEYDLQGLLEEYVARSPVWPGWSWQDLTQHMAKG